MEMVPSSISRYALDFVRTPRRAHHRGARAGEHLRDTLADAATGTGHHGHPPRKPHG